MKRLFLGGKNPFISYSQGVVGDLSASLHIAEVKSC